MLNPTEKDERSYLHTVIDLMRQIIASLDEIVKKNQKELKEYKEYLWENLSELDRAEKSAVRNNVTNSVLSSEAIMERKKRLRKMIEVPYFGRIDFTKAGDKEPLEIYVGIHSLYDPKNNRHIIYDWRAPISTMFYDYELGEAKYDSPVGELTGRIDLKRQFRIRQSIMELMLENSINIDDDILQKELSTTTDERMKNIVATIQKEQNAIIRNEEARNLIIQGVAGSGKTSIALHRVAYILYTYKGQIKSEDILIISPNKVFSDYISNVLPELGEEQIEECLMEELISKKVLEDKYTYQTFFEQVSEILETKDATLIASVKFKSSREFIKLLDEYIVHLENTAFQPIDIMVGIIPVANEWIKERFLALNRLPMRSRIPQIAKDIKAEFLHHFKKELTTQEMTRIRAELKKMLVLGTDLAVYESFFKWCGHSEYFFKRKGKKLDYSDLAPIAYLHIALEGLKEEMPVKHLLVDEMQDYSPIQYRLLTKLFRCKKTILGDAQQNVNPFSSTNYDDIAFALYDAEVMKLCKSYRSSFEITEFAQKISKSPDLVAVERHGEAPKVIKCKGSEYEDLGAIIKDFEKSGGSSMGVICKTEKDAKELYDNILSYSQQVCLLSSESAAFSNGIVVTTAHMAKGLEFDEVVVPSVTAENYSDEMDKSLLYVACTRAMHKLTLLYVGNKSPLIE